MKINWLITMLFSIFLVACLDQGPDSDGNSDTGNQDPPIDDNNDDDPADTPPVPTVTISGKLEYQDRIYNANGFISGNTPMKPIRQVVVEIVNTDNEVIATTTTDNLGNYSVEEIPEGENKVRIIAETQSAAGQTISVRTHGNIQYSVSKTFTFDGDNTVADIQLLLGERVAGIYNMLDVMSSGFEFFDALSPDHIQLQNLNIFWQYGQAIGSYTCFTTSGGSCVNGPGVYVLSDPFSSTDTDDFDDDVLWHEFAHFIEYSLGQTESPGGAHSLSNNQIDLRLAWSEGHATYLQMAIKTWLRATHPERLSIPGFLATSHYVDNKATSPVISVDYANLIGSQYRNATNEAAISKSLWFLQDRSGIDVVWQPVIDYLSGNSTADTFEAFWDGLIATRNPSSILLSQWQSTLSERAIHYQKDAQEDDNEIVDAANFDCTVTDSIYPATCINGQTGYLYSQSTVADKDMYALSLTAGVTYQIATDNLRNGADTKISLLDVNGNELLDNNSDPLVNDDAFDCELQLGGCNPLHDGTHFSSALEYTPSTDITVYLLVQSSSAMYDDPTNYGYLARYGDYDLTVTAISGP
mgnify:FL=1